MSNFCVVVAEGARARFFTLEYPEIPEMQSGPDLVEQQTLVNPEHRAHQDRIFADTRGGRNRTSGGEAHGYDEHRDQYDADQEAHFAQDVAGHLERMARDQRARRLVLCAEKRMLGFLRTALNGHVPDGVDLREVPKDLAKLKPRELHGHLAADGHLPRRRGRGGTH